MSGGAEGDKIPSNKEIVDDLCKDLENNTITPENNQVVEEESNEVDPPEDDFDDNIDDKELEILENELNLSESDKESRKTEALALKKRGNEEYLSKNYVKSIQTYTEAIKLCPLKYNEERAVFYSNRAACKLMIDRKKSAIDDCSDAIRLNDKFIRAYLRRAKLYEQTEDEMRSFEDYKKVLELDPGNSEAMSNSVRIQPIAERKQEEMKTQMLGQLKDLGNLFLKPFGLSTNNFNLVQDPNSGGYSVNFSQNAKTE